MGDFPDFYGCDGYPHGLSMDYLRQAQWTFGHQLPGMEGHAAPGRFPPFAGYEDTYAPEWPKGHRLPGHARFETFIEHPFGRLRHPARPARHYFQRERPARYARPYMRPGVQDNMNRGPHLQTWNIPIRAHRQQFVPFGVPQSNNFRKAEAAVREKSAAERNIPLGRAHFAEVRPRTSTHAHLKPPVETRPYGLYMQPPGVFTPHGGPDATLFERLWRYSSTQPTEESLRNRYPTQGHCSTINDDESEVEPESWNQTSANGRCCQTPENTDMWENITTSSNESSPPKSWTPLATSYSEQHPEQQDYFNHMPDSLPRTPTFHDRIRFAPSPWPRHRRRLPRESTRKITTQLRHLQSADRQLKRERRHLFYEQNLLHQQKEALRAEKAELKAAWLRLLKARSPPTHPWSRRPPNHPSLNSSDDDSSSIDSRSGPVPPVPPKYYPGPPSPLRDYGTPNRDPDPTAPTAAAALENYNRAWTAHSASPTSTALPWPTASLQPDPLTQAPRPLPRALQPSHDEEAINTSDVIAYNTVAFFARAVNLRPRYVFVEEVGRGERTGLGSWELGVWGLERAEKGLVAKVKTQVGRDLRRWHEDKREKRGGVEEEWARAVYAGVFAVWKAVNGELKSGARAGNHARW